MLLKDDVTNGVVLTMTLPTEHLDDIHPFWRQCKLCSILESLGASALPTWKLARNAKESCHINSLTLRMRCVFSFGEVVGMRNSSLPLSIESNIIHISAAPFKGQMLCLQIQRCTNQRNICLSGKTDHEAGGSHFRT
jgi:hypothetical protein